MRVEELRSWLDKAERGWTAEDVKFMGEFKDQVIYSPRFEEDIIDNTKSLIFVGWDHDNHIYWDMSGLGIFIDTKETN